MGHMVDGRYDTIKVSDDYFITVQDSVSDTFGEACGHVFGTWIGCIAGMVLVLASLAISYFFICWIITL